MIVSINQPAYLPWLGYFQRIAVSDLHIVLDHVQFEKNSFTNRNRVHTNQGPCWLTVPVSRDGAETPICDLRIDNRVNWRRKHQQSLKQHYAKAPFKQDLMDICDAAYERSWDYLHDLCRFMTGRFLRYLKIDTEIRYSRELGSTERKSALVLDLCQKVGADVYLSGALGRDYLDMDSFRDAGIAIEFQDYRHPEYNQSHGTPFEPYLSIADLIANCGPDSPSILLAE